MSKLKIISALLFTVLLSAFALLYVIGINPKHEFTSPLGSPKEKKLESLNTVKTEEIYDTPTTILKNKPINILLLGVDRRSKEEVGYRTDIMILMTVNQAEKKVLMTSVPRDLWINGGRINATFTGGGWEAMQSAFEKITGQKPSAYIQCDFEDLIWLVDAMGGLEVELDNSFTDNEYPNDVSKTYTTISFQKGLQKIDGKSALILS